MHDTLLPIRKRFREVGLGLTIVSAIMTGVFGWTLGSHWAMSIILALGLMCATFASAYVWPFVADAYQRQAWVAAGILTAFGILVTGTDLTTNFGSVAWQRTTDIDTAKVQNAKFDDRREAVTEGKTNLAMWQKRLADLQEANAWVATVNAEALRAQLASANLAIEQEAKRGGCGSKCLSRTKERDDIATKIALAEEKADLTGKIEATQRVLDKHRDVAAVTKKGESAALLQNTALASIFTLSLDPSSEAQHWTDKGIAWLVAAFFAFGAMGCNFVGWTNGAPTRHETNRRPEAQPAPTQMTKFKSSVRDAYERHCRTFNTGAIPRAV